MLYKITKENGRFKVFFNKKKGFKFKKSFTLNKYFWVEYLEYFIEDYLRLCCLECKQNGWVHQTQLPKSMRSSLKGGSKCFPPVGTLTICPECKAEHCVQHEDFPISQRDGSVSISHRIVLTLASPDGQASAQQGVASGQPVGPFSLHVDF